MCLIKKHKLPKIAWKPIVTHKELYVENLKEVLYFNRDGSAYLNSGECNITTPYMDVKVTLNSTIKSKSHWFWSLFKRYIEGEGVHSHKECINYPFFRGNVLVEAIIPRFSLYWEDKYSDVASTKLYLTDKIISYDD